MLRMLPLMAIIVVIYNAIVFLTGADLQAALMSVTLPSLAIWTFSLGDFLVTIAIVILFVELVLSASARPATMINHGLSLVVFIVCLVEFLLIARCGTATFFLIMLLALLDVVAGYTVSIAAARRDFMVDRMETL